MSSSSSSSSSLCTLPNTQCTNVIPTDTLSIELKRMVYDVHLMILCALYVSTSECQQSETEPKGVSSASQPLHRFCCYSLPLFAPPPPLSYSSSWEAFAINERLIPYHWSFICSPKTRLLPSSFAFIATENSMFFIFIDYVVRFS